MAPPSNQNRCHVTTTHSLLRHATRVGRLILLTLGQAFPVFSTAPNTSTYFPLAKSIGWHVYALYCAVGVFQTQPDKPAGSLIKVNNTTPRNYPSALLAVLRTFASRRYPHHVRIVSSAHNAFAYFLLRLWTEKSPEGKA